MILGKKTMVLACLFDELALESSRTLMTKQLSRDEVFNGRAEIAFDLTKDSQADRKIGMIVFTFGNILNNRYILDEQILCQDLFTMARHLPDDCRPKSAEDLVACLNKVLGEVPSATIGIYDVEQSRRYQADGHGLCPIYFTFRLNPENESLFWERVFEQNLV